MATKGPAEMQQPTSIFRALFLTFVALQVGANHPATPPHAEPPRVI